MTERPGGLKPLCVIAIILGSMGLAGAVFGVASQLAEPRMKAPIQGPKAAELNATFERRIRELNRELRPLYWSLFPFAFAASGLLLAGGVLALKGRGRGILQAALGGSLVVDLVAAVIGILTQSKTMDVMTWYFKEAAASGLVPKEMGGMMGIGVLVGIVIGGGWYLAKAVYYAWGLVFLRKPAVRSSFSPAAPPASS